MTENVLLQPNVIKCLNHMNDHYSQSTVEAVPERDAFVTVFSLISTGCVGLFKVINTLCEHYHFSLNPDVLNESYLFCLNFINYVVNTGLLYTHNSTVKGCASFNKIEYPLVQPVDKHTFLHALHVF